MISSSRGRELLVAALLVLFVVSALLTMYWPLLGHPSGVGFFGIDDAWMYTVPTQFFFDHSIHSGEFPFWNPLVYCGQPIACNPQYLLYYPPNLLRTLLTLDPTPWKTAAGVAMLAFVHAVWAALGVYGLGRYHGLSRSGAILAGIAFAFSSAYLQRLFIHHHITFVVAWLPWNLLAIAWAMNSPDLRVSCVRYALAGLCFGLTLLAGSPAIVYLICVAMLAYWATIRFAGIFARRRLEGTVRDVLGGTVAVVVALAVAAALLVPAMQFMEHAGRTRTAGERVELEFSRESATVFEALAFYPGGEALEGVKGIGAAPLLLCGIGLLSRQRRLALVFATLAVLLFSASRVDSWLVNQILAPFAPFPLSSPGRMSLVAVLPLSMLAGLGFDRLGQGFGSTRERLVITTLCLVLTAVVVGIIFSYSVAVPSEFGVSVRRAALFPAVMLALLLVRVWTTQRRWLLVVVAAAAVSESFYWQSVRIRELASAGNLATLDYHDAARGYPDFWEGNERGSVLVPNAALYTLNAQINGYDPLQLRAYSQIVHPGMADPFFRGDVDVARTSLIPYLLMKRSLWLHRFVSRAALPANGELFPVTTTAFVDQVSGDNVPFVSSQNVSMHPFSDQTGELPLLRSSVTMESGPTLVRTITFFVPASLPHVHTVLQVRVLAESALELHVSLPDLHALGASEWVGTLRVEPSQDVQTLEYPLPDRIGKIEINAQFLSSPASLILKDARLILDRADENGGIEVLHRSANEVTVRVRNLPDYRILSLIDFAYPGWHVYVDGREAPLFTAFSYFKGVEVPPGSHEVRFVFRSTRAYLGIAISLSTIVLFVAYGCWWLARGRKTEDGTK